MPDLLAVIDAEKLKLTALVAEDKRVDAEAGQKGAELAKLLDAPDEVLLDDRYPRKLADAERAVADVNVRQTALRRVIARSRACIEDLDGQLAAGHRARVLARLLPMAKQFDEMTDGLSALSWAMVHEYEGINPQPDELFRGRDVTEKLLRAALFESANRLERYVSMFTDRVRR
jgi:hypothetical protein